MALYVESSPKKMLMFYSLLVYRRVTFVFYAFDCLFHANPRDPTSAPEQVAGGPSIVDIDIDIYIYRYIDIDIDIDMDG